MHGSQWIRFYWANISKGGVRGAAAGHMPIVDQSPGLWDNNNSIHLVLSQMTFSEDALTVSLNF